MQVQSINTFSFDRKNSIRKTNCQKAPAFRAYGDVMTNVVKRDLRNSIDVSMAFEDLYKALKSTCGVKISPDLALLEDNGFINIHKFMEKICAPIAKVPSSLRDLVFKSEEENITLLDKEDVGSLTMCNFGKKGFFNSIFNSQDAKNDIKFLFSTPQYDSFEIGITKNGGLNVEQIEFPEWTISKFSELDRISRKSGTFDTVTPIW